MIAVIPVAGWGKRLRPLTYVIPKALIKVAGKEVIHHIVERIRNLPIDKIVLVVSEESKEIKELIEKRFGIDTDIVFQKERLGLGHAIYLTKEKVKGEMLIILGDTIVDTDYEEFTRGCSKIASKVVEDPRKYGVAEVDGKKIINLIEKPEKPVTNIAVIGLYYIKNADKLFEKLEEIIKKDIRTKGEYQLTDALNLYVKEEHTEIYEIKKWLDCGSLQGLVNANKELLYHGVEGEIINSVIIEPCLVRGARIENSVIGPYCYVEEGANISDSVIKGSIIYEHAKIEGVYIEDSIIGCGSEIRKHPLKMWIAHRTKIINFYQF